MSKETPTMATKTESTVSRTASTERGVVPGVVHLALDVADRGQSTTLALINDGRTELVAFVHGGIELAEKATASFFRLFKKATARIDEASAETLASVERLVSTSVRNARETTKAATELATTAIGGLTGTSAAA
jgi:hypothetical protein